MQGIVDFGSAAKKRSGGTNIYAQAGGATTAALPALGAGTTGFLAAAPTPGSPSTFRPPSVGGQSPAFQLPQYDYSADPLLQSIIAAGSQSVSDAEAQADAQKKQALIGYGYDPSLDSLFGGDQSLVQTAQGNPFSFLTDLQHGYDLSNENQSHDYALSSDNQQHAYDQYTQNENTDYTQRMATLLDALNKQNLTYGSAGQNRQDLASSLHANALAEALRGFSQSKDELQRNFTQAQTEGARGFQGAKSAGANKLQGVLGQISGAVLQAKQAAEQQRMQAEFQAQQQAMQSDYQSQINSLLSALQSGYYTTQTTEPTYMNNPYPSGTQQTTDANTATDLGYLGAL